MDVKQWMLNARRPHLIRWCQGQRSAMPDNLLLPMFGALLSLVHLCVYAGGHETMLKSGDPYLQVWALGSKHSMDML